MWHHTPVSAPYEVLHLHPSPTRQTVAGYGIGLFFLLIGVYFLTFRGFPLSQDGYFIFDSTESLVRRGNFYRTYEYSKFNTVIGGVPWGEPLQEPLTSVLLAPFFWLGQFIPNVGTVHVTMLFNIFITALTGVSLYAAGQLLGYKLQTAFIAALLFGLTTLAWVYSRHLFREPLMTLFVFWCVISAIKLRQSWQAGHFAWSWAGVTVLTFIAAFLTKAISVALLPGLFILLLPPLRLFRTNRRLLLAFVGIPVLFIAFVFVVLNIDTVRDRYSIDFWLRELRRLEVSIIAESFLGYQVSFSRSIWLHSPVLIAGIFGAWLLYKRGHWRQVVAFLLFVIILSSSYAMAHRISWWGNWGWGPRYMLPLIPVLMLWTLPVIECGYTGWQRFAFWSLAGLGFTLQLLGMSVPLPNYYTDLNRAGILTDFSAETQWEVYNWTWEWSPIKYHIDRLDFRYLDFAWNYVDGGWIAPAVAAALVIITTGGIIWFARQQLRWNMLVGVFAGLLIIHIVGIGVGLWALRADDRYIEDYHDVYELAQQLDDKITDDSSTIVFIDRDLYLPIFLNYFKSPVLTASLPYSPGENYGPEGPEIITDVLEEQIGEKAYYALEWAGAHYDEIWLVASSGPFEADKLRPIERYLATTHFPIESIETSPLARAIRYAAVESTEPDIPVNLVFGEQLTLDRIALPAGSSFAADEVIPVTLAWQPIAEIPDDYNVSVQVATSDGFPIAQRDGQPQGTFGAFSQWKTGTTYLDNHGIALPEDAAPGEYIIQVIIYRWQDGQRLTVGEGDIARIATIEVR